MGTQKLDRIFNPKTIAVIGATNNPKSVGYHLFKNIIGSDFDGIAYPINPNRKSVQGVKAYPDITKVPDKIDLAIIATPANTVQTIVEQCGKAGVHGAVVVSAGFNETGNETKAHDELLHTAKKYGMRIIGPNCLGFIRPEIHLNASFANKMPTPGKIAFISQSGALCTAVLDWAIEHNVGFSHFVSIGAMIDVGFDDLIDYFGNDPETKSILIYMESVTDARRFMSAARSFARNKPIIVLKAGKSEEGAKAATSHTGSLAGNDAVFSAAFKRAGVISVNTIEELFDCAKALDMQKRPAGNRLTVITNAGGPGILSTDHLISNGGKLSRLSDATIEKLNEFLPTMWSRSNPIDIIGDADPERYKKTLEVCMHDPNTDGILVILTPQSMTDPSEVARHLVSIGSKTEKTILASFMGESSVKEAIDILQKGSIPAYRIPENAAKCFSYMHMYSKNLEELYETPATIPHAFTPKTEDNRKIIDAAIKEGRYLLDENEAKQLLANYSIPINKSSVAKTAEDAAIGAEKTGFPVVMKILSPDILHKTEIGGVKLNIRSKEEAKLAFEEIIRNGKNKHKAKIKGVFIEKMDSRRYELLIGCKKDPIFGPAIVFGMGGVAVEVFKDTNVGLPPLNMALAMRMIEETKVYHLLKGYRNMPGVDIKAIQFLLYKFAYLVMDFPEIKEIDINPFAVEENGGVVLDAKVVLDKSIAGKDVKPYSHLVISPYPKEYVKKAKLKDGKEITLRPIRPEDEPMEAEMFTHFSEETQRFRFFTRIKDVTHEMLVRYTQIDYDREMAIIAEITEKDKKKMMGVVRLIADPDNDTAEFAIVVADPWQKKGLGSILADYIMEIAKKREIGKVYAYFLSDNFIMKTMFEKRGFTITNKGDNYYAELKL
jgi:acetyltransferase